MRALVGAIALFVLSGVVITWPQAAHLATHASDHHDVYFNMWRFAWFAHAATSPVATLLDGNIFFPERHTLAFSDAMPVAAVSALPLLLMGVPPVLVHNLVLLAGILLSAIGIFVLARSLTGSAAAATTAGMVFAFASYRFEHYGHMELQWTVWIPWAFWALERVRASARWRDGVTLGLFVALQFLSSIYYGIYLVLLLSFVIGCSLLIDLHHRRPLRGQIVAFGLAAAVALVMCLPYARAVSARCARHSGTAASRTSRNSALSPPVILPPRLQTFSTGRARNDSAGRRRGCFPASSPSCSRVCAWSGYARRACSSTALDLSRPSNSLSAPTASSIRSSMTTRRAFRR